jgi:hypothetical protein
MSFEDTLAGDKLLWGLGGSFGKNMKTISKHFGERVAVCAKHPTTRCEEWWEGTLQLSKNDRVIVLKYAARWNDEIDDLNDVDAHDDGLSDHTLEKRFDADDVVNVRRLTAEEDGDLLDGADDAVSKLRTPPADAPGRGVNVDFTWKIENVSAFRGILETRKLFSRFFPAGGVNLRLGAYESFDTLCVYLESDQGSTPSAMKNKTTPPGGGGGGAIGEGGKIGTGGGDGGGGGDGDGDYWVRYRVAVTNQKHPDRTKWKDATTSSKRWTSNVIQFMPTEDLTHPEGGYLVKDSIALAVEVLDVCYFNPDVDDGGSGFSKGDVAGAASMLPAIMKAAMNENAAEALRCVLYTGPHTTRRRGERRSLRTFPSASLRPPLAFNPRPRRLSAPLLTPFNSTPTFARTERPSARRCSTSACPARTSKTRSALPRSTSTWTTATSTSSCTRWRRARRRRPAAAAVRSPAAAASRRLARTRRRNVSWTNSARAARSRRPRRGAWRA